MAVVPLAKPSGDLNAAPHNPENDSTQWVRIAAACTLAASGALLATGKRRAGLVTAVAGLALTAVDQKETVKACWEALPGYLDQVQGILNRAQTVVEDLSEQGQKLRQVLGK
jgi:hypothetical protein